MIGDSIKKLTRDEIILLTSSICSGIFKQIVHEQILFHQQVLLNMNGIGEDSVLVREYRKHSAQLEVWQAISKLQSELLATLPNQQTGDR